MDTRLLLAYGAMILAAALIVALVWFGTRGQRAYSRQHKLARRNRKKLAQS